MTETEYKKMIQQTFDQASAGYDGRAMRFFDLSAEHLVKKLPLKGGENLLDAATGTGKIAIALAKRVKSGRVKGIDLSAGMLEQARQKAASEHLSNVTFEIADAGRAQFDQERFDGITCGFGVFFWPDMEGTLKNLLKALKPGGFFAATSFDKDSFEPLSGLCLKRFEKFGVQLPKTYTWERLDNPQKHQDLFASVGLKNIESETRSVGYFLKDEAEWWDLVCHSGFRGFLNQLSAEQAAKYKEEHLSEIRSKAGPQGIYLDVRVIFTTARQP